MSISHTSFCIPIGFLAFAVFNYFIRNSYQIAIKFEFHHTLITNFKTCFLINHKLTNYFLHLFVLSTNLFLFLLLMFELSVVRLQGKVLKMIFKSLYFKICFFFSKNLVLEFSISIFTRINIPKANSFALLRPTSNPILIVLTAWRRCPPGQVSSLFGSRFHDLIYNNPTQRSLWR